MTDEDLQELALIEAENSRAAKLIAEKDAQIEAQRIALLNAWDYCESLSQDAERYRWLRARPLHDGEEIYIGVDSHLHRGRWALGGPDPAKCDAAIDAAMATAPAVGDASVGVGPHSAVRKDLE